MKIFKNLYCVIICSCFQFDSINSEYYSSISAMFKLYDHELYMLTGMEKYINMQENKLNYLKNKLIDYEREHAEALKNGQEYFVNPINGYLLNKRLTLDWEKIKNSMEYDVSESFIDKLNKHGEIYNFPKSEELYGAVQALIRMQTTYKIDSNNMANGELNGVKYSTAMSADDCYHIGKMAINQSEFVFADTWLYEALERHERGVFGNIIETIPKTAILELLGEVNLQLGNTLKALKYFKKLLIYQRDNEKALKTKAILENYKHKKNVCEHRDVFISEPKLELSELKLSDEQLYQMACRGELKKPTNILRELHCGYLTETHPFLILAPIKVEELSLNPLVVIYYDVLNNDEIEKFKEISQRRLRRASVVNFRDGSDLISEARTSQFTFLTESHDAVIKILDQRMEDMTGLTMNTSEVIQVANYGIGGHYSLHTDSFDENSDHYLSMPLNKEEGNRIATLLFYMSDVEQGGATVFPHQNITIYPKKGAAAFWYSLHATGDPDIRSLHGACPTLVGSKWVLNKWIRLNGQIFHRPCDIYPDNIY